MIDQAFAAPVRAAAPLRHSAYAGSAGSWGIGCHVHRSAPVRASKARTSPLAGAGRELSAIDEPTITRSLTTTGGDVTWYAAGNAAGMRSPSRRPMVPSTPKAAHGLPDTASIAVS